MLKKVKKCNQKVKKCKQTALRNVKKNYDK